MFNTLPGRRKFDLSQPQTSCESVKMTVVAVSTVFALVVAILSYVCLHNRRKSAIPRIGPKPRILGNTSRSYFYHHSLQLIEEGYAKVTMHWI